MRPRNLQRLWLVPLLAVAGLGAEGNNGSPVAQAVQNRDHAGVRALLKQHADVNVPTVDGTTALHWAVQWNDLDTAGLLIRAGANVNVANRYGATPLWLAGASGDADMVETLLKAGADPNTLALGGESPLMAAALAGSAGAVKALLAHGANVDAKDAMRGQTALMWAVGNHEPHPDVVRVLLEHGADVHIHSGGLAAALYAKNRISHSGVDVSGGGDLTALLFAVRQNDVESVRLLLNAGANPSEKGRTSALLVAINNSYYDLAQLLLDNGADANAADNAGFTPLHVAVRKRAGGRTERTLKRAGGNTDERSTAVLKALLAHRANVNARLPLKRLPKAADFNPNGYPDLMDAEYGGATPLWMAANAADLEAMQILVAAGADPAVPSMEHTTPLMVAAGVGYGTRGPSANLGGRRDDTEEAVIAAVKQLLEWGNDVNAVNDNGQTALHGAAGAAAPSVAQFLVDHGARLDQKDGIGRTPLGVAEDNRTDKYRTNQSLDPVYIQTTYALLRKLSAAFRNYGDVFCGHAAGRAVSAEAASLASS